MRVLLNRLRRIIKSLWLTPGTRVKVVNYVPVCTNKAFFNPPHAGGRCGFIVQPAYPKSRWNKAALLVDAGLRSSGPFLST
jgi:hypothetical protein